MLKFMPQVNYNKPMGNNITQISPNQYSALSLSADSKGVCLNNNASKISFSGSHRLFMLKAISLKYLNKLPIKLTKYDDVLVKKTRGEILGNACSMARRNLINKTDRTEIRAEIVEKLVKQANEAAKNRNLYLLMGLPGSGKSTFAQKLSKEQNAFHIDFDLIRNLIPENIDKRWDFVVNDESNQIRKSILDKTMQKGCDLVVKFCGFNVKDIYELLNMTNANKYKVNLIMINLPIDKAINRSLSRFHETNHFMDPFTYRFYGHRPYANFQRMVKSNSDSFKSIALYSSDVPKGEEFKLVEKLK